MMRKFVILLFLKSADKIFYQIINKKFVALTRIQIYGTNVVYFLPISSIFRKIMIKWVKAVNLGSYIYAHYASCTYLSVSIMLFKFSTSYGYINLGSILDNAFIPKLEIFFRKQAKFRP